jgi:hypothetical protein
LRELSAFAFPEKNRELSTSNFLKGGDRMSPLIAKMSPPMFRKWTDEKGLVFLVNESIEARKKYKREVNIKDVQCKQVS